MDYRPAHHKSSPPRSAARVKLERMSEPWAIGKVAAVGVTLFFAVLFGSWVASGQTDYVMLVGMWFVAAMVIIFVQDQWWSPALIITALAISTNVGSVPFSGYEIGVAILAITFPIKMAMKTLRKSEPEMNPGVFFWLLITYVSIHAIAIIAFNHIQGVRLKNIIKAYYEVIAPLAFYGLMVRYCHTRTVKPGCVAIYCCTLFAVFASIITIILGIDVDQIGDLNISIGWLNADGALGVLRQGPVALFIGGLAYWPAVKSLRAKSILALGIMIGLLGALTGGGRISLAFCLLAAAVFAFIRNRIWMAVPAVIVIACIAAISTANPDAMNALPLMFQRALAPFNFSDQKTEEQQALEGSNDWHSELRTESLNYWLADTGSFWVGHGFKPWDESLSQETEGFDFQRHLEVAVEMGRTENTVSSTTNIFGLVGLVLYFGFLIDLAWRLWKACRLTPVGIPERAICEFALINLSLSLLFCLSAGGTPNFTLLNWGLGLVATRAFIAGKQPVKPDKPPAELPSFIPRDLRPAS